MPPEAISLHRIEVAFRRLVIDHGDAARGRAAAIMPKRVAELSGP